MSTIDCIPHDFLRFFGTEVFFLSVDTGVETPAIQAIAHVSDSFLYSYVVHILLFLSMFARDNFSHSLCPMQLCRV
eukprot:m.211357 g.211357  ORF g.211357 m.211357 type:complete len:76 (+) comp53975_c0_seq23:1255-1482(+)